MTINPFTSPSDDHDPSAFNQGEEAVDHTEEMLASMNKISQDNAGLFASAEDSTFTALFETDEETMALVAAKEAEDPSKRLHSYLAQDIDGKLEEMRRILKKQYPMGGIKSSRFITTDILMKASPEYFGRYDDFVRRAVISVQSTISDKGQAEVIGRSQEDPTDETLQDTAYRIVQSAVTEYMEKSSYRSLERAIIINLVCNEIIGFSLLDPLWRDPQVDEILCNGPKDVQVEIKGTLHKVPGCNFRDTQHLSALVERLYGSIGKVVSRTTPIVDGRLHDNSRMAVVHDSVAPAGPNFSIRRHKEDYIPPQQLINWGTASEEMMTFLGNLLYKGCSILVLGGTSSGKTTLLGALAGFFRPAERILTLEDSLELKLPKHKYLAAPMECLPAKPDNPNSGVTMRDLVKASLRQRPNAIIVGEVRDGAAYDLCQALNTGHYGMSTVHANNEKEGIYRLVSLVSQGGLMGGNAALPLIAASFDVIVCVEKFPTDGSRKIVSVSEVAPFPQRNEAGDLYLPTKTIWKFVDEGLDPHMKVLGHYEQVGALSKERRELRRLDLEPDLTWEELQALSNG